MAPCARAICKARAFFVGIARGATGSQAVLENDIAKDLESGRPTVAEIDLGALRANCRALRAVAGGSAVMNGVLLASAVVPPVIVIVLAWVFLRAGRSHDDREREDGQPQ